MADNFPFVVFPATPWSERRKWPGTDEIHWTVEGYFDQGWMPIFSFVGKGHGKAAREIANMMMIRFAAQNALLCWIQ